MPPEDNGQKGWTQWGVYILKELERLNQCYNDLDKSLDELKISYTMDITNLKIKSGIWGAVSGLVVAVPTAIAIAALILKFAGG